MFLEMSPYPLASASELPSKNSGALGNPGFSGVKINRFCLDMVDKDSEHIKLSSQYTAREIIDKLSLATLYRWNSFITLYWALQAKFARTMTFYPLALLFNPRYQEKRKCALLAPLGS